MLINHNNEKIRYTGRWNIEKNSSTSTANGNYFEFKYSGECAVLHFDTTGLKAPLPHLYIQIDDGAAIETTVDKFIRISAKNGEHTVCVILKSSVESHQRWFAPIEARVSLVGIEADNFSELPKDTRPIIEFIGDSITEGISIDTEYVNHGGNSDMVYWDDSTAGYAWLTAKSLDMRPVIMGYGCLGTTKSGAGDVPPVGISYGHYSDGYPMTTQNADYIVINHGTNDFHSDKELFLQKYFEFLYIVRKRNPKAKIVSLTPFSGRLAEEIKVVVDRFNNNNNDNVLYINTTGWIEPEPIHPTRDGHKKVCEKLTEIIKKQLLSHQ